MSPRKQAALSFLQQVIAGKIDEAYATHVSSSLRHHNPGFAGDMQSLKAAMKENHAHFPKKVLEVRHTLEEGNLVAVHSHIRFKAGEDGIAALHLFRFEGDRIVEMWDLGQPVPKDSPNRNGMF